MLIWLGLAGAAGTILRYLIAGWAQGLGGSGFPWGTLVVNAAGCFLFGVFWGIAGERGAIRPEIRQVVLIGFFGAFTTFSSFAFETMQMIRDSQWLTAGLNVAAQNSVGLGLLALGSVLGRAL